jgi:hypothetical protein
MNRRVLRRLAGSLTVAAVGLVTFATPAAADPAGPTDYRTDVVRIEPAVAGVDVRIIGGDSFVLLRVDRGVSVEVVGYRGEPYLRFRADGSVERNETSPSRWLNDDRYGSVTPPADASPDAAPTWEVVASDGTYAWHDHRAHWMNPVRPPGAEPGDTVLEAVIPLVVGGNEVAVHVRSVLLARPSPVAGVVGALVGLALLGATVAASRRGVGAGQSAIGAPVVAAAFAMAVGFWAFGSVPAETGPASTLWTLPGAALLAGIGAQVGLRRRRRSRFSHDLLVALAAVELGLWAWSRRSAVVRASIPTDAPQWLDRATVTGVATVAVGTLVVIGAAAVTDMRRSDR